MEVNIFALLGGRNKRKSSTVRALTGMGRRGKCQIEILNPTNKIIDITAYISSLQEAGIKPEDFIRDVLKNKSKNVLVTLWIKQRNKSLPSGNDYLQSFIDAGFHISQVVVLGTDEYMLPIRILRKKVYSIKDADKTPNNKNIYNIKKRWKWR